VDVVSEGAHAGRETDGVRDDGVVAQGVAGDLPTIVDVDVLRGKGKGKGKRTRKGKR
jgi:hypothetical protein